MEQFRLGPGGPNHRRRKRPCRGIGQAVVELGAAVVAPTYGQTKLRRRRALRAPRASRGRRRDGRDPPESIAAGLQAAVEAFGHVDVLVNNAGITRMQDTSGISPPGLGAGLSINVGGACSPLPAVLQLPAPGGGRTCQYRLQRGQGDLPRPSPLQRLQGRRGQHDPEPRQELAPFGINVNAACPGRSGHGDASLLNGQDHRGVPLDARPTLDDLRASAPSARGRLIQPVEVGRVVASWSVTPQASSAASPSSVDAGSTPF